MKGKRALKHWLWYFSIPAAAILLYKLYDNFSAALGLVGTLVSIFAPFVGGFVLAFFLYRPSLWLENRFLRLEGKAWPKLARPLSLATVYLVFLGLLALVFYLVIPILISSITELSKALPGYVEESQKSLERWFAPGGFLEGLNLKEMFNTALDRVTSMLTGLLTADNLLTAIKSVTNIASGLVNVVLSFIVSIYMLSGREHLIASFKNFVGLFIKPRYLTSAQGYLARISSIFYRYFYGAFLDALLVGVVVSVGLTIFQVPYAVLLGMAVGLLNMIPYFGAIIGGIGVALVTLLATNFYTALGVAVYIVVVQQIDANIIQPRVVGESVGLRPIYVLLSITLFGGLLGFWGVFLAPPLMAVVQLFVREATIRHNKKLAEETPPDQSKE